ncbi:MAG: diphthamide biosynthesis enzyme Dph2 [Candidatus Hodarchaeales archaeon]|jgi:2-(3-amino-3-carboxypropyl)histidine synthase
MSLYYDLELDKIQELVLSKQYKKIFIQMPEGLLHTPLKTVIDALTPIVSQVIVAGDPSYGICDLAINQATQLECDLLIHYGHNEFGFQQIIHIKALKPLDILIIPAYVTFGISSYFSSLIKKLKELQWNNIGLIATVQHLKNLHELKNHLDSLGIDNAIQGEGQILGCHIENIRGFSSKVDGIISLHAGYFHTYGLLLSTSLPILQLNPFTGETTYFSKDERKKLIHKRHSIINRARPAKVWGILGSSKIGQNHLGKISRAEKILQDHNKSKISVIAENLNFENLANFTWVDAWVDTACPRLAIDDHISFEKPILTFKEFLYLFNEVTWERILAKGFF